jgi:MFS family permease
MNASATVNGTERTDSQPRTSRDGSANIPAATAPVMTRRLALVFALAAGAAVGNLYWAQPLLDMLGRDLHVSASTAGLLVTLTQIGYAVGIFFIVPLGDVRDRRRLITTVMLCGTARSCCARSHRRSGCCSPPSRPSA